MVSARVLKEKRREEKRRGLEDKLEGTDAS
jgi:hypothetical protein